MLMIDIAVVPAHLLLAPFAAQSGTSLQALPLNLCKTLCLQQV